VEPVQFSRPPALFRSLAKRFGLSYCLKSFEGTICEMQSFSLPPAWLICIAAAGKSKCSLNKSSRALQLCDFLGNSANAVRWQVWTALLLYVLMRFLCLISSWNHSFTRLFTLLRAALWKKIDLWDLLRFCGTAGGHFRYLATPQDAYFPGFA
jgi:hypothetical protein